MSDGISSAEDKDLLAEKLMVQLKAKDTELENNKQENKALDTKMEQLQDEFSKMLAEQQKQMMAQFQAQFHPLEQKLKEAEQRAQMGKNELEEIIQANQQIMEKFREEMDKKDQQAIGSSLNKFDKTCDKLMSTSKILANPKGIVWDRSKTEASISECGLKANDFGWVFATEGYAISGEHCRKEYFQFLRPFVFYYEVTVTSNRFGYSSIGFTDGSKSPFDSVGGSPNSYGISADRYKNLSCWLSGEKHKLGRPNGSIAAGLTVYGSGLLLNSQNELDAFFTLNGILLGKQIRINPTVNQLYPTVYIYHASVEANFGENLVAKPFKFGIGKCPGLPIE